MDGFDTLKISEDKKRYIVESLNPILEEMVAECIHRAPANPMPFMLEWLIDKKNRAEDNKLTPEQKTQLTEENGVLQHKVEEATGALVEAAMIAADAQGEPEEEEEDDDNDEPPEGFFERPVETKARASVSAEAYGEWNTKKAFVPPVISKTDEQRDRLKGVLSKSFMFMSLDDGDLNIVIGAMKEVTSEAGKRIINAGDSGDFLFVIEKGKLDCKVKADDGSEKTVKTCEVGDVFGELSLLYNAPRAASVDSTEACVLWQLDRDTFSNIVKEAAQKKRQRYDTFLQRVPILANMDAYERSQLADALKPESFDAGRTIISQGEVGSKFYIIEEGEAVATKSGVEVMTYCTGDYFGELSLLRNQPRAATVMAKSEVKLLAVEKVVFMRLLNVKSLLDKSNKYK